MNLLFWNINCHNLIFYIKQLLIDHNIDIAIFAEYDAVDFHKIEVDTSEAYRHIRGFGGCDKITALVKKTVSVKFVHEQARYIIYNFVCNGEYISLAGIHLQDRWSSDTAKRLLTIRRLVQDIANSEDRFKTKKSIVVGDFNANPYDDELLLADAFNAVLFKDIIIQSETCKVAETTFRRFYNPILNFIGEKTKMYGSYYNTTNTNSPVWHCLDQVIVSKALCNRIEDIRYLKNVGHTSLMARVKPKKTISDHLPLLVTISKEEISV